MNHKEVLSVKELASPVNEVLERLEWECFDCKNHLMHQGLSCQYSGKVRYSWIPQVGEWCIWDGFKDISLIYEVRKAQWLKLPGCGHELPKENVTPILDWQEIEKILEKAGYMLSDEKHYDGEPPETLVTHKITIMKTHIYYGEHGEGTRIKSWTGKGKFRLIAVYDAVLALGKELK